MKRIFGIILFLIVSTALFGQTPLGSANSTVAVKGGLSVDSSFRLPMQSLDNRYTKGIDTSRNILVATIDTLPYYMKWGKLAKLLTAFDSNKVFTTPNFVVNYGKSTVTGSGSQSLQVLADYWLIGVSIRPASTETIKIGLTPGGSEVLAPTQFTGGSNSNVNGIVNYFSSTSATTIYFSGATGSVVYKILQQ